MRSFDNQQNEMTHVPKTHKSETKNIIYGSMTITHGTHTPFDKFRSRASHFSASVSRNDLMLSTRAHVPYFSFSLSRARRRFLKYYFFVFSRAIVVSGLVHTPNNKIKWKLYNNLVKRANKSQQRRRWQPSNNNYTELNVCSLLHPFPPSTHIIVRRLPLEWSHRGSGVLCHTSCSQCVSVSNVVGTSQEAWNRLLY